VEKKNKEIVSQLLSRGAKFDIPDNEGRTALQLADGDSEIEALFSVAKESLNKICDIGSLRSPS
jgi:ankyrin repeat protein